MLMRLCRGLLGVAVFALCGVLVASATGLDEVVHAWARGLHFPLFYGLTLLSFLAFPRSRRRDLTMVWLLLAALAEAGLGLGRPGFDAGSLLADGAGVAAAYGPTGFEALRRRMREHPFRAVSAGARDRRQVSNGLAGAVFNPIALFAWLSIAALAVGTVCPPELRPHLTQDPQIERFMAFFAVAAVFVLAFPRRPIAIALASAAVAVGLELCQVFVPGRDAGLPDIVAKSLGGITGAAMASWSLSLWARAHTASAARTVRALRLSVRPGRSSASPVLYPARAGTVG